MKNTHDFHIYIPLTPIDQWSKLKKLAKNQRRPVTEEIRVAIENHLKANGQLTDAEIRKLLAG